MNKAVPWNVNGVGFDAREAARDAARRQGKSLGEWLQGVISDHAEEMGVGAHEIAGKDRIAAVTSKLERLSASTAAHDRRVRDEPRRRAAPERDFRAERDYQAKQDRDFDEDEPAPPRRRREASARDNSARDMPAYEPTDLLLEEAIDAMERRAARRERKTEDALQSFAEMLERNEAKRDRERESVGAMAKKLSDMESRLTDRLAATDDNPIKGALARLEARLDSIGRRSAAEAAARQQALLKPARAPEPAPVEPAPEPAPYRDLDRKLSAILDAVRQRPSEVSPVALAASQAAAPQTSSPPPRESRRLGAAIADISRRQETLASEAAPLSLRDALMRRQRVETADARPTPVEPAPFVAMQGELATLASRIEDLRRDVVEQRAVRPQPRVDFDLLRGEIASMSEQMRGLAPRGAIANVETAIQQLSHRIETVREAQPVVPPIRQVGVPAETARLEAMIQDLDHKMEAVRTPGADHHAMDALQGQIALLAKRFESSNEGLAKLSSLEQSMQGLFAHLEQTRANVETASAKAAREVLRIAMEEGRAHTDKGTAVSLAAMKDMQDEAEARTNNTLSAVHETLERVVDRLAVMETAVAEVRVRPRPAAPAPAAPPVAQTPQAAAKPVARRPEIPLDAVDPSMAFRPGEKAAAKDPKDTSGRAAAVDLDDENGRANFIAAARRAAQAAQAEAAVAEAPAADGTRGAVRAGLIEQSRDFVARHKKPVLLSIAALFMIVGTMSLMQRVGMSGGEAQVAQMSTTPAPAPVARMADATPAAAPARVSETQTRAPRDEMSPSALPKTAPSIATAIPGSDPVQTASISPVPSLPSFAAQNGGGAPSPVRPTLPAGLKSMADAGDGAAQYTLGTQYAEGRAIPRDFRQAASLYQKAADQGLAPAQYRLASLYEKGLGVTQDKAKARTLYLRAAESGNPRAMHNLAVLLADGDGKPDYEGAATWFRKAAQYGIHDSQYNLAILLARGLGTQQSLVQSYQWFAIAAAQNDPDAAGKRDEVATKLGANDLAVAKALAASFRPRTADIAATEVQPPAGGWSGSTPASGTGPRRVSSL